MNKALLKQKLSQHYNTDNWKEILEYIFPNVALFQIPQDILVTNEKVKTFRQLGNVRLNDGKTLAVFDIQLKDNVDIARNRVELRNLTTKYIDQEATHGVLAVFASDSEDYRFTFTAQETEFDENMQLVTKQTEPKRYTYVLGPNESCQTASDRFFKLHEQKNTVELENVVDAFSVEKLNKEFFNKYKEHYEDFVQFITGKRFKKVSGKWKEVEIHEPSGYLETVFENDNKQARDFVKKLIGRMVFVQFLQKKGWMGCSVDSSEWGNGDHTFCKSLFESANQDQFHSNYLAHLFDALNTSNRENDVFDLTQTRVPYLNGGLFEADSEAIRQIDFPGSHFESLLNFFGEYNFTIDENDPNDHEVGIDPEMLGHIFENLLEDNKDKGAFYTPKPIVQYMCQESLIQYLKTHLENETTDIENFIRTFDKGDESDPNNYILQNDKRIKELLDRVKICDPAIGSGAFPMGLLQIIFRAKMSLDWTLDPAEVKRGIIQNSIYGVDIEKGAVDIARLRFWLSLIVYEKAPQPLPNLDYKIMQGDSLLESFEGVDLSQIGQGDDLTIFEPEIDLFGNIKEEQLSVTQTKSGFKEEIQSLIDAYFTLTEIDEKQQVKSKINAKIHEHIDFNLELQELQLQRFINNAGNPQNLKPKAKKKVDKWLNELDGLKSKRQNLHTLQDQEEKPYFLWNLFFADVFKDGGFDIVIANPPYVDIKGLSNDYTKILFTNFQTSQNRINLYSIFIELSTIITKHNGFIAFINPNSILMNSSYLKIRSHLINDIAKIIKLPDNIFTNAVVETILLFIKKSSMSNSVLGAYYLNKDKINFNHIVFKNFNKDDWKDDDSIRYNIFIDDIKQKLLNKMGSTDSKFNQYFNFSLGITPYDKYKGHSKELIEERQFHAPIKINKLYKPIIAGKRVKKYIIENKIDEYLKYGDWLGSPRKEKFFIVPRVIVRQIVSGKDMSIYAGYTTLPLYHTQIGFSIIPKNDSNISVKLLLALINSSIIRFYHKFKFLDFEKKTFQKLLIENCKQFPLPIFTKTSKKKIVLIIDQILTLKKNNPQAETTALEVEIDQLLYKLYGLTDEEIQIVEESV
ncbi:MAG: N-6 DNA methylase [Candidatus Marinimicrobia bacterium]|nr:N-6 DNA methylase [Candidatus Neomarinimicrobiota bacterium]MBT5759878.1 N-6 DNA methylase [Candidatus Neomarinimicrobiota bacterium]MBT6295535.1 N-6 DNA methylase [Nitrospina sp.]MBT7423683.1 N-6 DNA methylase [Candidatus Neomarinimicrobiota bacterium]